jgi:outer membrane protein
MQLLHAVVTVGACGAALLAAAIETTPPAAQSLTLVEAESTALRNQPTIAQARGQLEAAQGRVEEARAGYLPQVTTSASYQRQTGNFSVPPGTSPIGPSGGQPIVWTPHFDYWNFNATGSQLIYDFGQTSGRWRSADSSRDAAADNTHTIEIQAVFGVRRAYFAARAQRDLVKVAEDTVSNQEKHVEQTRVFVRAGIQPDINLATVLTGLANAKVQLVTAQNNYFVAEAQLAQAMGVPVGEHYQLSDEEVPAIAGEDGASAPLVDRALRDRPELANFADQRRAQEQLVSAIRGSYGPSLGAVANVRGTGSTLERLVPNWYIGLGLTWAIFQGGLTTGQVREAKGNLQTIGGQEAALRLQVQVDVEQARLGVQAAKATIGAADEAVVNARQQLTLAEGRYEHGLGSAVELGDAQVSFTTAEAQSVQAKFNLAAARAQLLAALGDRATSNAPSNGGTAR